MRWQGEVQLAAEHLGYVVVQTDGVDDYQGWGVHLLRKEQRVVNDAAELVAQDVELEARDGFAAVAEAVRASDSVIVVTWAVVSWSYGSCSGCDSYEDRDTSTPEACVAVFGDLIETCDNEDAARAKFSERKGW